MIFLANSLQFKRRLRKYIFQSFKMEKAGLPFSHLAGLKDMFLAISPRSWSRLQTAHNGNGDGEVSSTSYVNFFPSLRSHEKAQKAKAFQNNVRGSAITSAHCSRLVRKWERRPLSGIPRGTLEMNQVKLRRMWCRIPTAHLHFLSETSGAPCPSGLTLSFLKKLCSMHKLQTLPIHINYTDTEELNVSFLLTEVRQVFQHVCSGQSSHAKPNMVCHGALLKPSAILSNLLPAQNQGT